jgi:hypothetical protein
MEITMDISKLVTDLDDKAIEKDGVWYFSTFGFSCRLSVDSDASVSHLSVNGVPTERFYFGDQESRLKPLAEIESTLSGLASPAAAVEAPSTPGKSKANASTH